MRRSGELGRQTKAREDLWRHESGVLLDQEPVEREDVDRRCARTALSSHPERRRRKPSCPLAPTRIACIGGHESALPSAKETITSLPRHQVDQGGIEKTASLANSARSASTSRLVQAST